MNKLLAAAVLVAAPSLGWGQLIKLDALERLNAKAMETANVTLDGALLQLAAKFMDIDSDADAVEIKKLIAGLRAITVRNYEFKNVGEYSDADVEPLRSQLRDPSWKRVIQIRSKIEGDSDVFLKTGGARVDGLVVISAEPKELTVVVIDGNIDPEGLAKLGGNFGIPRGLRKKVEEKTEKKEE